jgi:hypothetical protein
MAYVIDCVDGMQVRGETMDELRTNAKSRSRSITRARTLTSRPSWQLPARSEAPVTRRR